MQHKSTPTTNPLRLIAYVRVSTAGQAVNGDSPAAQEEACRAWADDHGHQVVRVAADNGLSGKLDADDRPGLAAALVEIESGNADGLVVRDLDRLARELHVQEAVLARVWSADGHLFDVTHGEVLRDDPSDPMRTFIRQVMGAAAQLEAGMIKARLRRGRQRKAERGGYVGGRQLHRRYGSTLVVGGDGKRRYETVPGELAVIDRIKGDRQRGLSLRAIAGALNADGTDPPSGGSWYPATVRLIANRG
jgi:DNA invertase Pin-like site-specific DNA recombinase